VAQMLDYVRFRIAFYCSTRAYWDVLRVHGLAALGEKLHRYPREGRWDEMAAQIPDEVIGLFAVVGTYDTMRRRHDRVPDVARRRAARPARGGGGHPADPERVHRLRRRLVRAGH
jgi:hypothetical protein